MWRKKRIIIVVTFIYAIALLFVVAGIRIGTVTYHVSRNEEDNYSKTYCVPFWIQDVKLDTKMPVNGNAHFLGWRLDSGQKSETVTEVKLKDAVDVYAAWIMKNPETDFLLPELHITSETNIENIDKYQYYACTYTITNAEADNCLSDANGKIKGRGNSTWECFDKKPYRIKFEKKQNLFEMGEGKEWILLSNSVDYTLMRNEIAFGLGNIVGLQYTSQCQWVQLFYNEEYQGLYLLCEPVETGIHRVNIEMPYDAEDIDISFLLEMGYNIGFELPPVENAEHNWNEFFSCTTIYPKPELLTKHQYEYIYAYMELVNEAILTKDWEQLTDLADMESFVNWYLVNEILLNGDIGWSMFAYKPQGDKLYLGPLWDFDQSGGDVPSGANYEAWHPDTDCLNSWFIALMEMDEFKTLLSERWKECLPEIKAFLEAEREKALIYKKDVDANYERWPVLGTVTYRIREEIGSLKTYEENVDFLFEWLECRINWMDSELGGY